MRQISISPLARIVSVALGAATFLAATASRAKESPTDLLAFDAPAKALLARMTLDEKIGQMTQPEIIHLSDLSDIAKYFVGSILSGGDGDPREGNSPEAWREMYARCQEEALKTRLGIPILYGVDAVHGHNNVLGAVIFPHNIGLGCTGDPDLVERIAQVTAAEVRATGIQWAFAPCVTVPQDIRWGRTYEGFSENADLTSKLGAAAVRGLQGTDLRHPEAVLACAKHFVGDGGTALGTGGPEKKGLDQGDTRVEESVLRNVHLKPYRAAVAAGVGSIMPSYSSWNGVKCSANKHLLTDVLKGELGFQGFLISDYNSIDQITSDYKEAIAISINAGMDMVMVPSNYKAFVSNLRDLVNEGRVPVSRIDDAVVRILRVKFAMGLVNGKPVQPPGPALRNSLGSDAHRALARESVRKSLVLLKNEALALPISKSRNHIHVAGSCADDIGKQCGGWTVSWQGKSGHVVSGTTILGGIRAAVSKDSKVTFTADGSGGEGADLGILVIGESPYAEGLGDNRELTLSKEDHHAFQKMKALNIPLVVVVVSGRPLIVNDVLREADALVAAWLPGSEGQGIADVLFGDYSPSGHLSFTWPKSVDELPGGTRSQGGEPLFDYGFGLSYQ